MRDAERHGLPHLTAAKAHDPATEAFHTLDIAGLQTWHPSVDRLFIKINILRPRDGVGSAHPPDCIAMCHMIGVEAQVEGSGIHGRSQFARFLTDYHACDVAIQACLSAHHWARKLTAYGHRVRLIAPPYVKVLIKRQMNDATDAEAIAEAATPPTMRFVEPRTHAESDLLIR